MVSDRVCSARPDELMRYAIEVDDLVHTLRRELDEFDDRACFFFGTDPMWETAFELEELRSWVAHVSWAFAIAGGGVDAGLVSVSRRTIDDAVGDREWHPADHLRAGSSPSAWLLATNPRCITHDSAGYLGTGFIEGRDGKLYPLVAPWVVRDGVTYHADDGLPFDGTSVLDLDGRDDGWVTIEERIGVERWRDAPGTFDRLMMGVGATVGGRISGSREEDVEKVTLAPHRAPYVGAEPRPVPDPAPPPYMVPRAPDYTPPGRERTEYPGSNATNAALNGVPIMIDAVSGAAMADSGSFAAYDITFQRNTDGRTRALYRRVYLDEAGSSTSVWITGPERNDQVAISYAPAS